MPSDYDPEAPMPSFMQTKVPRELVFDHSVHAVTCLGFTYAFRLGPIHAGLQWKFGIEYASTFVVKSHDDFLEFSAETPNNRAIKLTAREETGDLVCSSRLDTDGKLTFTVQFQCGSKYEHSWETDDFRLANCRRSRFFIVILTSQTMCLTVLPSVARLGSDLMLD